MLDLPPGVHLPPDVDEARVTAFFGRVQRGQSPQIAAKGVGLRGVYGSDGPFPAWLRSEAARIEADVLGNAEEAIAEAVASGSVREAKWMLEKRAGEVYDATARVEAVGTAASGFAALLTAVRQADGTLDLGVLQAIAAGVPPVPPPEPRQPDRLPDRLVLDGDTAGDEVEAPAIPALRPRRPRA